MLGTLVNTGAILFGSLLGLLLRRGLPQRLRDTVMQGLGLCVVLIGVKGAIGTSDTLCVIVSIVAGGLLGAESILSAGWSSWEALHSASSFAAARTTASPRALCQRRWCSAWAQWPLWAP